MSEEKSWLDRGRKGMKPSDEPWPKPRGQNRGPAPSEASDEELRAIAESMAGGRIQGMTVLNG